MAPGRPRVGRGHHAGGRERPIASSASTRASFPAHFLVVLQTRVAVAVRFSRWHGCLYYGRCGRLDFISISAASAHFCCIVSCFLFFLLLRASSCRQRTRGRSGEATGWPWMARRYGGCSPVVYRVSRASELDSRRSFLASRATMAPRASRSEALGWTEA